MRFLNCPHSHWYYVGGTTASDFLSMKAFLTTLRVVPTTGRPPLLVVIVWVTRDSRDDARDEIGTSCGFDRLFVFGAFGRMGLLKAEATFGDFITEEVFLIEVSERLFFETWRESLMLSIQASFHFLRKK